MLPDRHRAHRFYTDTLKAARARGAEKAVMRDLCRRDLFFLLYNAMNRKDLDHDWLYARCLEVQRRPNGYLDLWAREHYKSTIITFGMTVQDILCDPEVTIGIFSFNRSLAKGFLNQVKREFQDNDTLKQLFPDILYENPQRVAPRWNEDQGLIVKREGNPKESTVEAWGLIEGMPTGRHYQIRVYDDVVEERNVTNPEQIARAIKGWELSLNLGSQQVVTRYGIPDIVRYVGTRYHFNDPYREILKRNAAVLRKHPGTVNAEPDGEPVLLSSDLMMKKRVSMGPYVFSCQILLDPVADEAQNFREEWLQFWWDDSKRWMDFNRYLVCDPAGEKKKDNDYTVMLVIGLGVDQNYYIIDGIRSRLNLAERARELFRLHRMYSPAGVGYEKYGKDADIEHIEMEMQRQNYRFGITPLGGPIPKLDRIRKLIPLFESGRVYLPKHLYFLDEKGNQRNLTAELIDEEYFAFPVGVHDDILDCMARIVDHQLCAGFPMSSIEESTWQYDRNSRENYDPFDYLHGRR